MQDRDLIAYYEKHYKIELKENKSAVWLRNQQIKYLINCAENDKILKDIQICAVTYLRDYLDKKEGKQWKKENKEILNLKTLKIKNQKDITRDYVLLGGLLINTFIENNLLTTTEINRTAYIILPEKYQISLVGSAIISSPTLGGTKDFRESTEYSPNFIENILNNNKTPKYEINYTYNDYASHPGFRYDMNIYKQTKKLLEYSHVPYCVLSQFHFFFMKYFSEDILGAENYNTEMHNLFIKTFTDLDINYLTSIATNEESQTFVDDLRNHIFNFEDIFNEKLKKKYVIKLKTLMKKIKLDKEENNEDTDKYVKMTLKNYIKNRDINSKLVKNIRKNKVELDEQINRYKLYIKYITKVSHLKHFLHGLLNELHFYKDFDHFHLPKYLAYSGRMFTQAHFMNLQAYKQVKAFIGIRTENVITAENYNKYCYILKEKLKDRHFKKIVENTSFTQFKHKQQTLIINYALSNLHRMSYDDMENILLGYDPHNFKDEILKIFPYIKENKLLWQTLSQIHFMC